MKPNKPNIDELRWIRVFTPMHIPRRFVEQVRNRDYSVDDFYKYQEGACLIQTANGPTLNPLSHLYVLVNSENETQGFLWLTIDTLSKDIVVQTFSIDKEYWGKGKAVAKLAEFVKDIRKKAQLNKIYWVTNFPKHSERYGFKRSDSILMEYTEKENGQDTDGGDNSPRQYRSTESRTEELSIRDIRPE